MSFFRTSRAILSEAPGAYVAGIWTPGTRLVSSAIAGIQPVKLGVDLQALPEGRRASDVVKIYTDAQLKTTEDGVQPDLIVYKGAAYELISVEVRDSGVIPHQKYIAVRKFPFTSEADWLDGTTKRT